jgi:hypothetical protein
MLEVKIDFFRFNIKILTSKDSLRAIITVRCAKEVIIFFLNSILRENKWYYWFFSTFSIASSFYNLNKYQTMPKLANDT